MNDPEIKEILNEYSERNKRWTDKEIKLFKKAIKQHGLDYDKIVKHIGTKSRL